MTAFVDFMDLQSAVIEMVKRSDLVEVMPRLVKLAESDFNRRLRMAEQMASEDVTIASGLADLPDDFQTLIGVYDGAGREYVAQPPQALREVQGRGYFAIVGRQIQAAADEVLTVQYYATIPTISSSMTASNWLLQRHPGLYLYAVGSEAAKFMADQDLFGKIAGILSAEYTKAESDDAAVRYSRARVRVQGVTP